jgi:excisionase family DNA binding protein
LKSSELMRPKEVAATFNVHIKTVRKWANDGHLTLVKLPGGQCRYKRSEVESLAEVTG